MQALSLVMSACRFSTGSADCRPACVFACAGSLVLSCFSGQRTTGAGQITATLGFRCLTCACLTTQMLCCPAQAFSCHRTSFHVGEATLKILPWRRISPARRYLIHSRQEGEIPQPRVRGSLAPWSSHQPHVCGHCMILSQIKHQNNKISCWCPGPQRRAPQVKQCNTVTYLQQVLSWSLLSHYVGCMNCACLRRVVWC